MAKVVGVGGVFLRSADPARLKAWYGEHLGFPVQAWGTKFEGCGVTAWTAFKADSDNYGERTQMAMINYRVDDLDALLKELEAKGVWVDPDRQDGDFGKFAWIKDCDGNRVELWQPPA